MAKGSYISALGDMRYWVSGNGVVRIPGQRGFQKANNKFVKEYIRNVQRRTSFLIHHALYDFTKSFIQNPTFTRTRDANGNPQSAAVPIDTGNLMDSIVGLVGYKDRNGRYRIGGGKAIHRHPIARRKQWWTEGGITVSGWGKDYARNYEEFMRGSDEKPQGDVFVIIEPTIPYAEMLEDGEYGMHEGWFSDYFDIFLTQLKAQVNVTVENGDVMGFGEVGNLSGQIGWDL